MRPSVQRPQLVLLFLASVISFAGCNSSGIELPDLGSVTGKVTMDGNPLPNVMVAFQPEAGGRFSFAKTQSDGTYELIYIDNVKGAVIGNHKVMVTTPNESAGPDPSYKDPIPAKYNEATEITKEVKAGSNQIDIELASK